MKYLFLFVALSVVAVASGQDDNNKYKKLLENYQKKNTVAVPGYQPQVSLLGEKNYSFSLSNGNKVYHLPQDNMPCIAPDMKQFNMPNAGSPAMIKRGTNVIPDPSQLTAISIMGRGAETK